LVPQAPSETLPSSADVAEADRLAEHANRSLNSPKDFVDNIRMVVDAIGVDHVGIGTDTDLLSPRPGTGTNRAWPGMTGGFFPVVVEECLRQGFTAEEIGKIGGGNFGRVFGAVTGAQDRIRGEFARLSRNVGQPDHILANPIVGH
jgi:microsomal dipeptidase-like Zn-dependent dipeptidase